MLQSLGMRPMSEAAGVQGDHPGMDVVAAEEVALVIEQHLVEIVVWGLFYRWEDAMPDLQAAFYFSAVTYTTTGYGDLLLPPDLKLAGGVEALTGILMCGWSTGFFFAVVSRMFNASSSAGGRQV